MLPLPEIHQPPQSSTFLPAGLQVSLNPAFPFSPPVERSLQNLSSEHSLSLNLKDHYSLEINLSSTSTPASIVGSPTTHLASYESRQNLTSLEMGSGLSGRLEKEEHLAVLEGPDGLRSVEGSEADECSGPNGSMQPTCSGPDAAMLRER